MPPQQVLPPRKSDVHEGPEPAQEVGSVPARLKTMTDILADLAERHERALAALRRAYFHLQRARTLLKRTAVLRAMTRSRGERRLH
jgi:hypothetical protein